MSYREDSVSFTTPDGFVIQGSVYVPERPNNVGVICLHQMNLDRSAFYHLATALCDKGFTVLSLDERGHGMSVQRNGVHTTHEQLSEQDFGKIPGADIVEARKVLMENYTISPEKIGFVGASIGANAALIAAGRNPQTAFVVALSPGVDFRGLQPESDVTQIQKPVLLVAAEDDQYSYQSVAQLFELIPSSQKKQILLKSGGHGTEMLEDTDLYNQLIAWISERV